MRLRVQFYAQLRDMAGTSEMDVEMPESSTVRDLLGKVYDEKPALRAHDKSILVGVGVEFVERNHVLNPDEEISIMPPVQGG